MSETLTAPEAAAADLEFLTVDFVDALRQIQQRHVDEAGDAAIKPYYEARGHNLDIATQGLDKADAAEAAALTQIDAECEARANRYVTPDENQELNSKLADLLKTFSINHMDHETWELDEKDENGNDIPHTSGRAKLQKAIDELKGITPDSPTDDAPETTPPTDQEREAALTDLTAARKKVAELSLKRQQVVWNGRPKNQKLEKEYQDAKTAYHEASIKLHAMDIAAERAAGKSEEELHVSAIKKSIDEHSAYTKEQADFLASDTSKRGKIARWLAKSNRRFFASNVALGLATGTALTWAAKSAAVGIAGPAALGAGLALRTTKVALTSLVGIRTVQHREFDVRTKQDTEELAGRLNDSVQGTDANETLLNSHNIMHEVHDNRITKDRHHNQLRMVTAIGVSAVAGVVGAELIGNHLPQWGSGSHHPAPVHHGGKGHTQHHSHNHHPGRTDGFKDNIDVAHGAGYTNELEKLAHQKGIHLNGAQAWDAYLHVHDQVGGHFFTNDHSYAIAGNDLGISRSGMAHWNPAALHAFEAWLRENDKLTKAA